MNKSIILDSEYIERDIRATAILLDNTSRQLYEDGYITEDDYLALQMISKVLNEDIAKRTQELINVSYKLLEKLN